MGHLPGEPGILTPLVLPYGRIAPRFAGPVSHAGEGAAVVGRVTLGTGAWLGVCAVIRADGHYAEIGSEFRLGRRSTVHIAHEVYPARVGDRVAVGDNAVVHACTLGNDCVIEVGAVVLDGSVVEDEVVLEPGSVVFPRSRLARGQVYAGAPARRVRAVSQREIAIRRRRMADEQAVDPGARPHRPPARGATDASVYIASTAAVRGELRAAPGSSVWFGCDFDAGGASIAIGANCNVQDNTQIRCSTAQGVTIGANTTIGHNVLIRDSRIGSDALIGIGSVVEEGTVVEDHVLLAAGARTTPGQVLEAGWLWGGSPAHRVAKLDASKRELFSFIVETYRHYAREFQAAEAERLKAAAAP